MIEEKKKAFEECETCMELLLLYSGKMNESIPGCDKTFSLQDVELSLLL